MSNEEHLGSLRLELLDSLREIIPPSARDGPGSPTGSRAELLDRLRAILRAYHEDGMVHTAHERADAALLEFVGDEEIWDAFVAIPRWYA